MSSKGEETADERPAKRQRRVGAFKKETGDISFDDLNGDCLVHILSFLTVDEMNEATLINSRFREARNEPPLDQTRTATILCKSENMTFVDLYETISSNGWDLLFDAGSNTTRLKLILLERPLQPSDRNAAFALQSVTCLDLSIPTTVSRDPPSINIEDILAIALIVPNLQELDLSYVQISATALSEICRYCPNLTRVKWNGSRSADLCLPWFASEHATMITELSVDSSTIVFDPTLHHEEGIEMLNEDLSNRGSYVWKSLSRLERLSMKNASYESHFHCGPHLFSQNMLIKLVRHHPTLRWLRSDLTDENIAMLNEERPEVTLVNK